MYVQELLDNFLIESYEGSNATSTTELFITPKGKYYSKKLIKSIIYLEHVIGDTYINYREEVYERAHPLKRDLPKILRFINFIREREMAELHLAKQRGCAEANKCLDIIGKYPLCWRLLKSVCNRAYKLNLARE